jgi:mono/diheme cytochrome c family protein
MGIADGVLGKEMPAWSKVFSDQDIADVAEFVYREFITATPAN